MFRASHPLLAVFFVSDAWDDGEGSDVPAPPPSPRKCWADIADSDSGMDEGGRDYVEHGIATVLVGDEEEAKETKAPGTLNCSTLSPEAEVFCPLLHASPVEESNQFLEAIEWQKQHIAHLLGQIHALQQLLAGERPSLAHNAAKQGRVERPLPTGQPLGASEGKVFEICQKVLKEALPGVIATAGASVLEKCNVLVEAKIAQLALSVTEKPSLASESEVQAAKILLLEPLLPTPLTDALPPESAQALCKESKPVLENSQ